MGRVTFNWIRVGFVNFLLVFLNFEESSAQITCICDEVNINCNVDDTLNYVYSFASLGLVAQELFVSGGLENWVTSSSPSV